MFWRHEATSIRHKGTFLHDEQTSLRDEQTSLRDKQTSVRDKQTSVRDEQTSLRDKQTSVRDEQTSLRDKQTSVRDEQTLLRDTQTLLRGKATFLSDEEALLRSRRTCEHEPLNRRKAYRGHKTHPSSSDSYAPERSPDRGNRGRRHHGHDRQAKSYPNPPTTLSPRRSPAGSRPPAPSAPSRPCRSLVIAAVDNGHTSQVLEREQRGERQDVRIADGARAFGGGTTGWYVSVLVRRRSACQTNWRQSASAPFLGNFLVRAFSELRINIECVDDSVLCAPLTIARRSTPCNAASEKDTG